MRSAGAAVLMIAGSLLLLSPFTSLPHVATALHSGDGRVQAWVLAWVAHALTSGAPLFDANMFFPAPASLAHTDSMVALGLFATPLWLLTGNAVLMFNVFQFLGPAASSFAGYLLARSWTGDWQASIVGGLAFGLSFFALLHNAHLNLTWAAGLPLSMLLVERWWDRPTWPRLAALWTVTVLTCLTSWYLALMLGVLLVVQAIGLTLTRGRVEIAIRGPQVAAALALGAAVLLPFLAPYLGRDSEANEATTFAADWRSYLVPPEHTMVGRWLVGVGLADPQGIWGERTLFLGWSATALAAIGLASEMASGERERRGRAWMLLGIAMLGAALSFGPSPSGLAPFDLLGQLPGVGGFRATARFALLVGFACAMLAAFGVQRIRRARSSVATIVTMGRVALILGERVDFPAGRPRPEPMPEVYSLAVADGARAAIALPIYAGQPNWFFEGDYLLYSTAAGFFAARQRHRALGSGGVPRPWRGHARLSVTGLCRGPAVLRHHPCDLPRRPLRPIGGRPPRPRAPGDRLCRCRGTRLGRAAEGAGAVARKHGNTNAATETQRHREDFFLEKRGNTQHQPRGACDAESCSPRLAFSINDSVSLCLCGYVRL